MKGESEMRLGEFRTKTRDCENKLKIRLSIYNDIKYNDDGYRCSKRVTSEPG